MKSALLVLGMHRSGTSALSRALSLAGATLPGHLLPGSEDNEAGFWEPAEIVRAHDELLESAGSRWDDFAEFPRRWYDSPPAEAFVDRLAELVASNYGDAPLIVLKDPRLCRLVPLWLRVLDRVGARPHFVLPIRNPLEVAASLKKRDDFPAAKSALLWLRHVIDAERDSRGQPRGLLTYDALLADPLGTLDRISEGLGLAFPRDSHRSRIEIGEFLSEGLRHNRASEEELGRNRLVCGWVKRAFDALRLGIDGDEQAMRERLDAVWDEFDEAERAFGPVLADLELRADCLADRAADADRLEPIAQGLREDLAARDLHLGQLEATSGSQAARIQELEDDVSRRDHAIGDLERSLAGHLARLRELDDEILRRDRSIAHLEDASEGQVARIRELEGEVEAHRTYVESLERSVREQIARIHELEGELGSHRDYVASLERSVNDQIARIRGLEDDASRREGDIRALEGDVLDRDRRIRGLIEERDEAARRAEGLREEVAGLEDRLGRQEERAVDLERSASLLSGKLAARDARIRELSASVARGGRVIDEQRKELAERDLLGVWYDGQVAERDRQIEGLLARVWELEHAREALSGHLSGIMASDGWKALRVLRRIGHALAPPGSASRRASRLGFRTLAILRREGPSGIGRRLALRRARRRPLAIEGPGIVAAPADPAPARSNAAPAAPTALEASPAPRASIDEAYEAWFRAHSNASDAIEDAPTAPADGPLISVVMPVYDTPPDLLQRAIASVARQRYDRWELCIVDDRSTAPHVRPLLERHAAADPRIRVLLRATNGNISAATDDGIAMASGDYVALLDHDDELTDDALLRVAGLLRRKPETDVVYSDSDKLTADGRRLEPFFKPDWSPSYFEGVMYVGHLLVVRRSLLERVGGCDGRFDGVQDFELMLRLGERTDRIEHIPRVLYGWRMAEGSIASRGDAKSDVDRLQRLAVQEHLDRLGVPAEAVMKGTGHRVRLKPRPRDRGPLASILIPTRDRPELIGRCLESLFDRTEYRRFEVVVGDNETADPDALALFDRYPVTRVDLPGPFHFAAFNNTMARAARGEYLLLLNNDTEILEPDWIEHLLLHAERPGVGAVGPLLVYPDGTVQHAGVILGPRGTADHVMRGFPSDADGHAGSLYCSREVSAVTGACLMVRRAHFDAVGGLNERFRRHYEDVDFCLRLRATGLRNVYVGATRLVHHESKTRGPIYNYTDRVLLLDAWGRLIERGDPYYNANLDPGRCDYAIRPAA